jgi:glutamine amidotransferase
VCRHLAYLGPAVPLRPLLFDAPRALVRQARAPQWQASGRTNPDGWGVAWWTDDRHEPRSYRVTTAMWADDGFTAPAPTTGVLAAARLASPGTTLDVANTAPLVRDGWAFSLNGFAFAGGRGDRLRAAAAASAQAEHPGDADTHVLFSLVLAGLADGLPPEDALAAVIDLVAPDDEVRLNLLLTDGRRLAASRHRNSLFVRYGRGFTVASEPLDDDPSWQEVPDRSIVVTGGCS